VAAKLRRIAQGPQQVAENITVVTPLVVPVPGNRAVAAVNRRLLVRQVRRVLRGLPDRPVQIWSFAPDVDYMCGQFDEECVVYYCVDEFSAFSGYGEAETLAAERRLAARADLVITVSRTLHDAKRHLHENVVLVTHGVEYDHFAQALSADVVVPPEIAALPRPVLGFWGLIQDWVDLELLAGIARERPGWSIVLIGEPLADVSAVSELPNVHLLGRRRYQQLPAFARGFDVGLIPFRINPLTLPVDPIKLREYLSAGLPVVSTPLPEMKRYGDMVAVAGDAAGLVKACERMLAEAETESARSAQRRARQAAMRGETWRAKVREIEGHLMRVLCRRANERQVGPPRVRRLVAHVDDVSVV
jgi:glycosyltransferase involved in cell wall biosynthesis